MGGSHPKVNPNDGACNKGVAELNHDMRKEHMEVREGIAGEGHGLSEEDESGINKAAADVNETHGVEAPIVGYQLGLQKQQQQLPAPIVRWERFLPVRSLKVLLVENDDSTRHVVSALLRNCSYEVVPVAHGLEAWKVLEDLPNRIDLVLTEVVMPCLSGIGLLCKIMSHKTCKTIPVIMMSSNDSMGIVFKCLSIGAVDFLVKPIRKNELKNLWQHVWRRCHSSSRSGSESGIQNQKSTKLKSGDDFDNSTGSNDEDGNDSIGLNARDDSDNGSGTQSSWTKRAVEVDSPQQMSSSEQLASPHDSIFAQVIHPKPETLCIKEVQMNSAMDCKEQNKIAGNDLELGDSRNTVARKESYQTDKISTKLAGPSLEKFPEVVPSNADVVGCVNSNALQESSTEDVDLFGGIANNPNPQPVLGVPDTSKTFSTISENKDKDYTELPSLELSLKRLRSTVDVGISMCDERNVLKRSNLSAFSRYPTSVASPQAPTGYGGSSVLDNSSEAALLKQGSNGSSDNNDMGSTNKSVVAKPGLYKELAIKCNHPASAFYPVQPQNSTIRPFVQEKIDDVATSPVIGQSRGSQKQVQVQHHHHHYHHHHHHVHSLQPPPDQDDLPHKNLKATVAYCSSSNVFAGPVEANAANYSLHGSNSGSNHGSDEQYGCSTAINTGGTNMESSATGVAEKNGVRGGNGCGSVIGSGSGADQNRFAQREAALDKFRQKRKARNFGKKVRYQSRQRLAEQRPRVRGQFVRRITPGKENHEGDS